MIRRFSVHSFTIPKQRHKLKNDIYKMTQVDYLDVRFDVDTGTVSETKTMQRHTVGLRVAVC